MLSWPQSGMVGGEGGWGVVHSGPLLFSGLNCLISTAQDLNGLILVSFRYHYQRPKHQSSETQEQLVRSIKCLW